MVQYGMVIDLNRCVGCHSCSVACKSAWLVPSEFGRSWVKRLGPDNTPHGISHTFYPGQCNHCDNPSCVPVCPVPKIQMNFADPENQRALFRDVAAIWKDPLNGTVQIDKKRCTGCGACVASCPYEAIYLNSEFGDKGTADKCTFCVERLSEGLDPVCVASCPVEARVFGDLADSYSEVGRLRDNAETLTSLKVNLGPNVFYLGSKKDIYLLQKTSTPEAK